MSEDEKKLYDIQMKQLWEVADLLETIDVARLAGQAMKLGDHKDVMLLMALNGARVHLPPPEYKKAPEA